MTRRTLEIPGSGRGSRRRELLAAAALIAITCVVYVPAMRAGFVWDDDDYVQNNPTLRSAEGLKRIWFEIGAVPQYYPLVHTTYWLEFRLWGTDPTGYHVVNILLHSLAAVLLWRLLRFLRVPAAWVAAALFALHPVHVESVAWITERKNVLCGVFSFAAALAYLSFAAASPDGSRRSGRRWLYALSLGLFLCALWSKTVAATLPAALLLVIWWKRGRIGWREIRGLIPFFAAGAALGLLTVWMEKAHVGAAGGEWQLAPIERCLVAGRAVWFYAGKLFWPLKTVFIYPRWRIDATVWWQFLFPVGAVASVALLWALAKRIGRGPLVAVLYFGGTLVPALGFFDVYPMRYSFVADHFQYLASVGLIALAAAAGAVAASRFGERGRAVAMVLAGSVLLVLGGLTWRQAKVYANVVTLWEDTLRKNPEAWIAHNNLGTALRARGRLDEAIEHYRQALLLKPDHAEAQYNWANALASQGKLDEAIEHYREAIRIKPGYAKAHFNLAKTLGSRGDLEGAIRHFREGLRFKPDVAEVRQTLGMALRATGRTAEALDQFRQASGLRRDWLPPLTAAAWILATSSEPELRDPVEAVRLARRAAELTRNGNAQVLDTLAAAYAAAGLLDRAVATAERALALASRAGDRSAAARIGMRLELYRRGEPYREPATVEAAPPPTAEAR